MREALLCCQWEAAAVAGMIFGVPAEQQQSATCFFSPHFFQLMEIRRSDSKL